MRRERTLDIWVTEGAARVKVPKGAKEETSTLVIMAAETKWWSSTRDYWQSSLSSDGELLQSDFAYSIFRRQTMFELRYILVKIQT